MGSVRGGSKTSPARSLRVSYSPVHDLDSILAVPDLSQMRGQESWLGVQAQSHFALPPLRWQGRDYPVLVTDLVKMAGLRAPAA
jgi:hypothetical protein